MSGGGNDELKLPLDLRYVSGRVRIAKAHVLEVDVAEHSLVSRVRVPIEYLPDGYQPAELPVGAAVTVFLLRAASSDPSLWMASLRWPDPAENPWLTELPRLGDDVRGVVSRYVSDFGAIVTLENGIEAFLHRSTIPIPVSGDIAGILDIGDQISAEVTEINEDALTIALSVTALRNRHDQMERDWRKEWAEREDDVPERETEVGAAPLSGYHVVVIDDDPWFRPAVARWLKVMGAAVKEGKSLATVEAALAAPNVTHVLVDYLMPEQIAIWHTVTRWQSNDPVRRRVAMMSASPGAAAEAKNHNWPLLSKPFHIRDAIAWIANGVLPPPVKDTSSVTGNTMWGGRFEEQAVRDRFQLLLQRLCVAYDFCTALWVWSPRDGKYSLRSSWGLARQPDSKFNDLLRFSSVADALEVGKDVIGHVPSNDRLLDWLPAEAKVVVAIPVVTDGKLERCLVFYGSKRISPVVLNNLRTEVCTGAEDLAAQMALVKHMREQETFATTGRLAAGLLHEIRHRIGILELDLLGAIEASKHGKPVPLNRMKETLDKVVTLVNADLSMVQKQQRERLDVNRIARTTPHSLLRRSEYADIALSFHPAPGMPIVSLPAMVLEQPLINILDNAFYHVRARKMLARVEIRVEIVADDTATPIHITITDNGDGMTADQRDRLFQPRETSKQEGGIGMGLYVSRNLLRSVDGALECLHSHRWIGTAFRIRLPALLKDFADPGETS